MRLLQIKIGLYHCLEIRIPVLDEITHYRKKNIKVSLVLSHAIP